MQDCQFPFKLSGQTFFNCTDHQDPDGRLWCSTKVDSNGKHVGGEGNWGYCNLINGICPKGPVDKETILIKVVETVQEQQKIGLEKQKDANDILKRVVDELS